MKRFTTSLYAAAAVALAFAAVPAHASVITGSNLDFESGVGLTPNTDNAESANSGTSAVPGWTIDAFAAATGLAGVWAPQAGGTFFTAPQSWQGNQVGFLQANSNISQNLNGAFSGLGGTISVQLLLGEALAAPVNLIGDSITLLANGSAIASKQLVAALGGPSVTLGAFDLNTFNFAITAAQALALTGQTLGIEISNGSGPNNMLFFDDLVVNGTNVITPTSGNNNGGGGGGGGNGNGVPEPASFSLLGVALLGFAAWRCSVKGAGSFAAAA